MSRKELLTLAEKVTAGFAKKLSMVNYEKMGTDDNDGAIFLVNEGMENFITSFLAHTTRYDFADVLLEFPVLKPNTPGLSDRSRYDGTTNINLFNNWDHVGDGKAITVRQIADTVAWMKRYSTIDSESFLKDMD